MTNEELIAEARRCAPGDDATELALMVHGLADALEAETVEPEWVYRARTSSMTSGTHKTAEAARAVLANMQRLAPLKDEPEPVFVERRRRFAWEPVGGDEA